MRAAKTLTLILVLATVPVLAQLDEPHVLVRAGRFLDVRAGKYLSDQGILVDGSRIKEVGPFARIQAHASKDIKLVDLKDSAVLPGLIDCHTHLLLNLGPEDDSMLTFVAKRSTAERALLGAAMARQDLEAGITTVRDLGNSGTNGDVALEHAIERGWVPGPRMIVSTRALSPPGGQFYQIGSPAADAIVNQEYVVINSSDDARRAVQQALADGASVIKIIVNNVKNVLNTDEIRTVVEEAHRVNVKVAAHATTDLAVRTAVDAGVDSIEHGYQVSDESLRLMAQKGIFLVPTDGTLDDLLNMTTTTPQQRDELRPDMQKAVAEEIDRLQRARKAGVKIAAGSDMYIIYPGKDRGQASLTLFRAYRDEGMSPIEIIQSATANAAELLGWSDRIGSLEPGKFADIIAVPGDPLSDITQLEHVQFVMKGGEIVKNEVVSRK